MERHAPHQQGAEFAERRHEPVTFAERERRAAGGRLLAGRGAERAHPPLALQAEHPLVGLARPDHAAVEPLELRRRKVGGERLVEPAPLVEDPQMGDREAGEFGARHRFVPRVVRVRGAE